MPQTMLVVLLEVIKLLVTVMRAGCQRPSFDSSSLRKSTKFLLPSVIYAVVAAVYTESLFKTSGENFLEQQFWLYFYGMFVPTVSILSLHRLSNLSMHFLCFLK